MVEIVTEKPAVTESRVAFVQVINEPRPSVAALTPFTLVGEPDTDRGFVTPSGSRLRIRMLPMEVPPTIDVPGSARPATAVRIAFRVTVSLLTAANAVAKDSTGALLISPPHELYMRPGQMVEGFDVEAFVDQELRKVAYETEARVKQQKAVIDFIKSKWAGSLIPPVNPTAPAVTRPILG